MSKSHVATSSPARFEALEGRTLFSAMWMDPNGGLHLDMDATDDRATAIYDTAGTPTTLDDKVHVRMFSGGAWSSGSFLGVNHIIFRGNNGNDTLENNTPLRSFQYGGKGNDVLIGGSNTDYLYGETEDDKLFGNDGQDHLLGGLGSDYIDTGADFFGSERAYGGDGDDTIKIHAGDVYDLIGADVYVP